LLEKADAYKNLADKLLNHSPSAPQNQEDPNEKPATPIAHNTELLLELNLPLDQKIVNCKLPISTLKLLSSLFFF